MTDIVRCLIGTYLVVGIIITIAGFIVMHQDEKALLNTYSAFKIFWVFVKVMIVWPKIVWDTLKLYRHRRQIREALDRYEKRRK